MPIQPSEIRWYKSQLTSDAIAAQNGGRLSAVESVSNIKNNIFPDVPQAERQSGSSKFRKLFIKVDNAADIALLTPKVFNESGSTGDDYVVLWPGSQTDVQSAMAGSRCYGFGTLSSSVTQGATLIFVTGEHAGYASRQPFRAGDTIRISNQADVNSPGQVEYAVIQGINYTGAQMEIILTTGLTYPWNTATGTVNVASCLLPGDLKGAVSGLLATSASGGSFTEANLVVHFIGAVEQVWTLTITDEVTGSFRLDGDTLGSSVANGAVGADFVPINPETASPYFTLQSLGWTGIWQNGNTLTFSTHPAAAPIWYERVVPAGAQAIGSDVFVVAIDGDSA